MKTETIYACCENKYNKLGVHLMLSCLSASFSELPHQNNTQSTAQDNGCL